MIECEAIGSDDEVIVNFVTVKNGPIDLNVTVAGHGPLILCVHGWPEHWYSWRHQIAHFSDRRFTVAALKSTVLINAEPAAPEVLPFPLGGTCRT